MNVLFPQIFKGFDVICDILVTVPCSRLNVVVDVHALNPRNMQSCCLHFVL